MLTFWPKVGSNLRAGDAAARCVIVMEWIGRAKPTKAMCAREGKRS